jgi:hypothetical protein
MDQAALEERLRAVTRCIEEGEHRALVQQGCVDRLARTGDDTRVADVSLRLTHEALDCLYIWRALIQDELGMSGIPPHRWRRRTGPVY